MTDSNQTCTVIVLFPHPDGSVIQYSQQVVLNPAIARAIDMLLNYDKDGRPLPMKDRPVGFVVEAAGPRG